MLSFLLLFVVFDAVLAQCTAGECNACHAQSGQPNQCAWWYATTREEGTRSQKPDTVFLTIARQNDAKRSKNGFTYTSGECRNAYAIGHDNPTWQAYACNPGSGFFRVAVRLLENCHAKLADMHVFRFYFGK
jgi:hypothetical protein